MRRERVQRGVFVLLAFLMAGVLGWVDFRRSGGFSLSLMYLLPIGMSAWFGWRWAGILLSFLSAGIWLAADLLSNLRPFYNPQASYWNAGVGLGFFLTLALTLSTLRRLLEREKRQARTDALTGLSNVRAFTEQAGAELERARRHRWPLTLAYVDLDNFKAVNDRFGHEVGDECLKTAADLMLAHVRATDLIARMGGDEFAILLVETRMAQAGQVLDKLRETLRRAMASRGWPVTVSIGAMTFSEAPGSVHEMIRKADLLMYSVKTGGKDRLRMEGADG